ncbi:MAG TPA: hypothetical protein VGU71_10970 [Candidatus Dormibacteraeota bacterium]|nr:hypothetical protein [Candidatus Dormibacteraeota bacterium]
MITIARISSVVGAVVWIVGLPIYAASSGIFVSSDLAYFWFGVVTALTGLFATPVALAYPASPVPWSYAVRGLGAVACVGLLVTGALLVAGASGWLGDRPPHWITSAPEIFLTMFFVWVLLASYCARRSVTLGRLVSWLGTLAGSSFLVLFLVSLLVSYYDPGFVFTNGTSELSLVLSFLIWWFLPAWLIVFAARMRSGPEPVSTGTAEKTIDATRQTPPATPGE